MRRREAPQVFQGNELPGIEREAPSVDTARMDVAQITELRAWAARLEERASSDELRAAGKAIAMLVNEVEALEAKLGRAEQATPRPAPDRVPESVAESESGEAPGLAEPPWTAADERLSGSFVSRLKRTFGLE